MRMIDGLDWVGLDRKEGVWLRTYVDDVAWSEGEAEESSWTFPMRDAKDCVVCLDCFR